VRSPKSASLHSGGDESLEDLVPDDPDGWFLHDEHGFFGLVGPVWEKRYDGRPILGFRAARKHQNKSGVVQGGMLLALADRAMGHQIAARMGERRMASIQVDGHFVSLLRMGEFVIAESTILRIASNVAFAECQLSVAGRLVMAARGVFRHFPEHMTINDTSRGER